MSENTQKPSGYAYYALALLMVVYIVNFLDRTIIYILFPLIKKEMAFSDTQLSLLGTTSFVIFYTALGIPFGRLADKGSRTKIIAIGVVVWSLFSGATAFAGGFWTLFLCRVMVGVGEATLGPAAISLLSDYFPSERRGTVMSIYSMGIAIGSGLASILGGILSQIGWREAFMIVGFPGIILGIVVFFLYEPKPPAKIAPENPLKTAPPVYFSFRGAYFIHLTGRIGVLFEEIIKLLRIRSFLLMCLGYSLFGMATNSLSIWGATYVNRVFNLSIPQIGYWFGIMVMAAGIPATLFGGAISDWLRQKSVAGRMYYSSILTLLSFFLWIIILSSDNFSVIIPAGLLLLFSALAWLGAGLADVTETVPTERRGLAVAVYFFSVNIAAYLIGSNLVGKFNDVLGATENPDMMRYSLLISPLCCLLATICLLFGSRALHGRSPAMIG